MRRLFFFREAIAGAKRLVSCEAGIFTPTCLPAGRDAVPLSGIEASGAGSRKKKTGSFG